MSSCSRAALFLRATPPLITFSKSAFPKALLQNKRFRTVNSCLQPPDVSRLAQTARISLTPQQVEEFAPKIRQVVDWFGQLQAVDLQSIEPAIRAGDLTLKIPKVKICELTCQKYLITGML
ncbi:hypothetical protein ACP275_05G137100 [Erythranthe tilingii]